MPTGSATSARTARSNATGTPIRTRAGGTARLSRPGAAAASSATASTWRPAPRPDLPVAWSVETAKAHETRFVADLLDTAKRRGAMAAMAALDKGYDIQRIHTECMERDCLPLIPLKRTPDVKRGDHRPPECEHGVWTFAGSDRKRGASKWRCPSGECAPASTWVAADRLHPLIPRETKRFKAGYRKRAAVEREFGRLKHEWGLGPLRVRGLERVRLHADLAVMTKLACALSRARGGYPASTNSS
ncbi:MAG: transposase [Solirubrobacterales bacterium]